MNDDNATEIMRRFGKAFFSRDPLLLAQVVTADVQWHFALGPDAPHGRVRTGVAGILQGIAENEALFEYLRFEDVRCQAMATDQIVMTYRIDGKYRAPAVSLLAGEAINLRGIELITVQEGRVHRKDVFWKQFRTREAGPRADLPGAD